MFNPKSTTMIRFIIDGEYLDDELDTTTTSQDLFDQIDMTYQDLID